MGWLGSLCKSIGRTIGKGIEIVGEVTGSETLKTVGQNLHDACIDMSSNTGKTDSYDRESARLEETKRINMILTEFSLNLEQKADEIEKVAIKESKVYFDELIKELKESESEIEINIERIKRTMNSVEREINGNLKLYISKRVSIDDSECLEILKMDAGSKKEAAMKKFSEKILQTGLKKLVEDVRKVIKEQNEIITEVIEEKLYDIKFNLDKQIEEFKLLETSKLQTEEEVNKLKCELNKKIQLSEACIDSLD